ncbi:MAG: M6 family metalloprotease domain-containing protein, partial [bacterium]
MMRPALKTHWVVLAALLWAVFYYGSVSAMPAPNFLITVTQPDGTPIQIRLFGDEWYSWAETEDGYTVIQDEDGWWRYAQLDEKGRFIPSDIEVSPKGVRKSAEIQFTKGLRKHLRESQEVVQERCEEMHLKPFQFNPRLSYREGEVPITNNILLILVDYPDLPHTETIESFGDMMGQENYDGTGSFNQYYREISYDKFGVTATVVGWYTAPNPHGYYGWERDSLTQSLNRVHELVAWAVQQADASVNFLQFDNDTNGVVDGLFLVHAGPGAEEGDSRNIWSHRHFLHWHYGDDRRFADGDTIDEYVIVPEKFETGHARIGTYCHEYGHVLGLPDLYDPDGSSYGIGYWGLMGLGGWGGDGEHPETPSHMCAWSKIKLGWVSPDVPTEDRIGQFILNVEENQQILKLWTNGDPSEEYFLAENRDTIKFDQHLPGCGLLIWHIDETAVDEWGRLSNQDENRKAVDLEAADGDEDMDYRQNEGDDGDPFPGAKGNQTFNASSNPNSRDYRGHNTYVEVKIMSPGCNPILADLKVSGPPGSPDLVIRDCPADVGVEPDIWCMDDFVSSPDIWIDNDGDGQPDPFGPGVVNRVWARIWNIGSAPATDVRVSFWRAEPTLGLRFPDNAARIVDHITGDSAVSVGLIPGNQTPGSGPGTVVSIDALLPEPPYCMGVIAENDEDLQTSISPLDDNNLAQLNLWSLRQRSVPGEQTVIASAITAANPTDRWRCFEIVVDGSLLPLDWDAWAEPESLDLDPGEELPVTLWVIAPVGAAHGDTGVVFADLFECGELDTSLGAVVIDVGIDNVPPDTVEDLTAMRLCPEGDDFSTDLYTVQLTWSPVQKDVAGNSEEIRLYYIHRDTTEGFEPDSTNLVDSTAADADTLLPDFQWKDRPDLTPPTFAAKSIASGNIKYYYKVASVDRAGNLSAPSNEASPRRVSCDSCVVQLTHSFTGEAAYDELGYSVSGAGDVNGDGFDDLIVGAPLNDAGGPDAGRAYLYSGTTGALLYTLPGGGPGDHFGWSVSGAGDVNDDGYADLIVGAPLNDAGGADAGRAYIYSGATGTLLYPFTGQAAGDWLGVSVSGAGDVNNDGYADLIVGAPLNDAGSTDAGRVYIYSGATGALLYTFTGEAAVDQLGSSVSGAGDVNNDGCDDLIV